MEFQTRAERDGNTASTIIAAMAGRHLWLRLELRMGIGTGPVVAGVVGKKKFIYDLWGDTVNLASRITSEGTPGNIQVDTTTWRRLRHHFDFEPPQTLYLKGKGDTVVHRLIGRAANGEAAGSR